MAAKACVVCADDTLGLDAVVLLVGTDEPLPIDTAGGNATTKVLWFCKPEHRDEWEKAQECGHAEIVAEPEIEGWENPTEPVQIILRCTDCKQNTRVVVDDVALLQWTFDPWGDPS